MTFHFTNDVLSAFAKYTQGQVAIYKYSSSFCRYTTKTAFHTKILQLLDIFFYLFDLALDIPGSGVVLLLLSHRVHLNLQNWICSLQTFIFKYCTMWGPTGTWRNFQSSHATNVTGELMCVWGANDKPGESKQNTVHARYRLKVTLHHTYIALRMHSVVGHLYDICTVLMRWNSVHDRSKLFVV